MCIVNIQVILSQIPDVANLISELD